MNTQEREKLIERAADCLRVANQLVYIHRRRDDRAALNALRGAARLRGLADRHLARAGLSVEIATPVGTERVVVPPPASVGRTRLRPRGRAGRAAACASRGHRRTG